MQRLLLKQQIKLLKPAVYIRHKDPHEEKNLLIYIKVWFLWWKNKYDKHCVKTKCISGTSDYYSKSASSITIVLYTTPPPQ